MKMIRLIALGVICCSLTLANYEGFVVFQTVPSKAGTAPTSPYSLLISGTFPSLATTASGGHVVNTVACGVTSITCPADLIFTRDSGCSTPMAGWEVISWSPTTGQLTATVEIPILSNLKPVKIYACVGDATVTTFQGGGRGSAYDSDYLLSFHLDETSGTTLHDSTANGNDAVKKSAANPAATSAGELGGAQKFTGTTNSANNDYALLGAPTPPVSTYTIEYWANALSYVNQDAIFLESHGGPTSPAVFTAFYWYPSGTVFFRNSYNSATPVAPHTVTTGVFHNIVYVRTGSTMNLFLDGVPGTPSAGFGTVPESWIGFGWDGGASPVFNSFNGTLDEFSFSGVARSSSYITARYNNVSSPSTFYTVGAFTPRVPIARSTTAANSQVNIF